MKGRHLPLCDRRLLNDYVHSFQRLGRSARRIIADKKTVKELAEGAPSWHAELVDFMNTTEVAPGYFAC